MAHQGYDLQLTRYDERGWRATFYVTGIEQSPTSAIGTIWEGRAHAVARDSERRGATLDPSVATPRVPVGNQVRRGNSTCGRSGSVLPWRGYAVTVRAGASW
jgi:hypothetical protein